MLIRDNSVAGVREDVGGRVPRGLPSPVRFLKENSLHRTQDFQLKRTNHMIEGEFIKQLFSYVCFIYTLYTVITLDLELQTKNHIKSSLLTLGEVVYISPFIIAS